MIIELKYSKVFDSEIEFLLPIFKSYASITNDLFDSDIDDILRATLAWVKKSTNVYYGRIEEKSIIVIDESDRKFLPIDPDVKYRLAEEYAYPIISFELKKGGIPLPQDDYEIIGECGKTFLEAKVGVGDILEYTVVAGYSLVEQNNTEIHNIINLYANMLYENRGDVVLPYEFQKELYHRIYNFIRF